MSVVCPPVRRSFSDEPGPGTFHSLGVLPKRKTDTSTRKSPVFHIAHDDGDDDEHSSSLDDEHSPPPLIRFPSSGSTSPASSGSSSSTSRLASPSPPLYRGTSTPILLSNGKPLKPSLKSSSSSPAMLIPPQTHFRASSEPSSPKNVHFPEEDYGLATVRVFSCSARPAALSNPANGNGDETETEGEDTPPARFPFPRIPPLFNYEVDPARSSPIPCKQSPLANLFIESVNLSSSSFPSAGPSAKPLLTGSVLVRNLAFEKHVAVRFTLDDWQTVSEVGAHYVDSLPLSPSQIPCASLPEDNRGKGWDRFTFTIRLEDYAPSLSTRTLWLVARYRVDSTYPESDSSQYGPGGEWWDNNGGENYRVGFKPAITATPTPRSKPRRETISVPISLPRSQTLATCKEHALGLLVPSISSNKERSTSLRAGKLNLCNYAPPTVRAPSTISFPSTGSPSSQTSVTNSPLSPPASSSDEDSTSPASSTLSTPTVSPTIVPRVIIGGQPATSSERDDDGALTYSKPGHIANWDWSAPTKPRIEGPPRPYTDFVPGLDPPERLGNFPSPSGRKPHSDSNSLYNAFVTQWCFAQGPSPSYHTYDAGGIMT